MTRAFAECSFYRGPLWGWMHLCAPKQRPFAARFLTRKEAHPSLFLDNVNGIALRSDTLASVLTERPARVRPLGLSRMVPLNF